MCPKVNILKQILFQINNFLKPTFRKIKILNNEYHIYVGAICSELCQRFASFYRIKLYDDQVDTEIYL
jgi:hypothetical protein